MKRVATKTEKKIRSTTQSYITVCLYGLHKKMQARDLLNDCPAAGKVPSEGVSKTICEVRTAE